MWQKTCFLTSFIGGYMRKYNIPFFKPSITSKEKKACLQVLNSGWLTTGSITLQFEKEFADFVNAKNAFAVSSASAGLHLGLHAANLPPQSRIILPSYTFAASAHAVLQAGYLPIFLDIEKNGFNIDPQQMEDILKKPPVPIRGIMPVHIAGESCDMHSILSIAKKHNLFVIEDAAHAFPAKKNSSFLGTIGDVGVFSFYASKTLTTAEGGMIITNNDKLARRIRIARTHGLEKDAWFRYHHTSYHPYDIIAKGFKYNLPDLLSAIGRVQLSRAWSMHESRKRISSWYRNFFSNSEFFILPKESHDHAWHLFIVRLRLEALRISRDVFMNTMKKKGISSSVHFLPLHMTKYFSRWPAPYPLIHTEQRYKEVLSLPLFCSLRKKQVQYITQTMKTIATVYS